jgi:hypothetical protein
MGSRLSRPACGASCTRRAAACSVAVALGRHEFWTSYNRLGVTHGALARACHAAYEWGSSGRAWNLFRRPAVGSRGS